MFIKADFLYCFNICCACLYLAGVVDGSDFSYRCYPNDTIVVVNPGAYSWYRADANDSTVCTVTPSSADLVLTGCSKDFPITLSFSNRTDTDYQIIHGERVNGDDDLYVVVINCAEISETGVFRNATVAMTPSIPQTFQQTVSPSFTLTSFIYTDSSKTERATTARSGDQLYWNIVGPIEYDHKPEECIAYAGLVVSPTVSNKTLISGGCTLDSSLVMNFEFVNGTGNEVCSTIYAFRFFSSPYVTFECKVRVCPSGESDCAIVCPDRRRRSAGERPLTDDQDYNRVVSRITIETPRTYDLQLKRFPRSESTSLESEVWWLLGVAVVLKAM